MEHLQLSWLANCDKSTRKSALITTLLTRNMSYEKDRLIDIAVIFSVSDMLVSAVFLAGVFRTSPRVPWSRSTSFPPAC